LTLLLHAVVAASADESPDCTRQCAHADCDSVSIKWGRFCGEGHTGCPGLEPCDEYDGCCAARDRCTEASESGIADHGCHHAFVNCLSQRLEESSTPFPTDDTECNAQSIVASLLRGAATASLFAELVHDGDGVVRRAAPRASEARARTANDPAASRRRYSAETDAEAHAERLRISRDADNDEVGTRAVEEVDARPRLHIIPGQGKDRPPVYVAHKSQAEGGGFRIALDLGGGEKERYNAEAAAEAHAAKQRAEALSEKKAEATSTADGALGAPRRPRHGFTLDLSSTAEAAGHGVYSAEGDALEHARRQRREWLEEQEEEEKATRASRGASGSSFSMEDHEAKLERLRREHARREEERERLPRAQREEL
jgi:hypothetical protein